MSTRRKFLETVVAAGAGVGLLGLSACGDDSGTGMDSGTDSSTGSDSGMDSSTGMDSGMDSSMGTDGGSDAGSDSGTGTDGGSDAGADAGSDADTDGSTLSCATVMATISMNHGHVAIVPATDVIAGVEKIYDIMGTSPHTHNITVTAADFTTLAGGGPVTIMSTAAGHTHDVTLMCGT